MKNIILQYLDYISQETEQLCLGIKIFFFPAISGYFVQIKVSLTAHFPGSANQGSTTTQ